MRMPPFAPDPAPLRVTVLILPGSSMMTVASVLDPMRACNRLSGGDRIRWQAVTVDGGPVVLTNSLPLAPHGRLERTAAGDLLMVVAGFEALARARPLAARLRRLAPRFAAVAGIESGAWVLGAAGLLAGHAATTHWEDLEAFSAAHPETEVRADRWVISGRIVTTGGASPAFDLMLHLIRSRFGPALALDVASVFVYDEAHAGSDAQPLVSLGRLGGAEPRVAQAIRILEAALEQPLGTAAVARRVGVSVRTLEGLFRRTLGVAPAAYAAQLRMQAARRLVTDTGLPLAEVAERTGFGSAAAFSRAFRRETGRTPRETRALARRPPPAGGSAGLPETGREGDGR